MLLPPAYEPDHSALSTPLPVELSALIPGDWRETEGTDLKCDYSAAKLPGCWAAYVPPDKKKVMMVLMMTVMAGEYPQLVIIAVIWSRMFKMTGIQPEGCVSWKTQPPKVLSGDFHEDISVN